MLHKNVAQNVTKSCTKLLGTSRSNDVTATRTSLKKWMCVLSVVIEIIPTYFAKCTRTLLNLNWKGPYSSSESEIKFCRCLFRFSVKHEISYFHVLVVQNGKEIYKKAWCTCKVVVSLIKPIDFSTFLWPSRRWILSKVLNLCYRNEYCTTKLSKLNLGKSVLFHSQRWSKSKFHKFFSMLKNIIQCKSIVKVSFESSHHWSSPTDSNQDSIIV